MTSGPIPAAEQEQCCAGLSALELPARAQWYQPPKKDDAFNEGLLLPFSLVSDSFLTSLFASLEECLVSWALFG